MTGADALWLTEGEIRALAAPLCEEDLSHRGDEIVLGEQQPQPRIVAKKVERVP